MDYLYLVIGAAIIISCFYFIIAPFFTSEEKTVAYAESSNGSEMPLEMIYETVNELEMDYLMKKISKEDFESMKKRYQALAASYLTHESNAKTTQSKKQAIDDETEREILKELSKLRKQKGRVE